MDMLQVRNGKIVDAQGRPVRLRGVCVGGWMNMEHFINQAIASSLKAKRELELDMFWMTQAGPTRTQEMIVDLARHIAGQIGDPDIDPGANARYLAQATLAGYASSLAQPAYARCFQGMSESDLDRVLQSFAFENCCPNLPLWDVLGKYMACPA